MIDLIKKYKVGIIILFFISLPYFVDMLLISNFPVVVSALGLFQVLAIIVGIPLFFYSQIQQKNTYNNTILYKENDSWLRQILVGLYIVFFIISIFLVISAGFVSESSLSEAVKILIVITALFIPISILSSIALSKRSLKWFLLPLLPLFLYLFLIFRLG